LYEGLANVLLLPPNDSRETSVSIGDIAVLGKDHIPGEKSHLTQSQILASYNGKCFRTIILSSRYPRAYFLSEIEIPKGTSRGDQTLAIEFYKYVDKESVEKIGEAYRAIQIR
ncbi:MAG: hypothetical protein ACE5FH_13200, partial [Candidatus Zixiibacteriota bacterium]